MNKKHQDNGEMHITIKAKNFKGFQKLIDKLPKIKDVSVAYLNYNTVKKVTREERERRLKFILEKVEKKPHQVYTIEKLKIIMTDFSASRRTIARDVMLLSIKKLIVVDTINNKGRFNVIAKNKKAISNYKKRKEKI